MATAPEIEVVVLTTDDILGTDDLVIEYVPVPEWGNGKGGVYVRSLRGDELDEYQGSMLVRQGNKQVMTYANMRAKLCAKAICDASGKRMFSDAQIPLLALKNAAGLSRVFEVASRLSGLSEKDVQELVDKLKNDQSAGSTSD